MKNQNAKVSVHDLGCASLLVTLQFNLVGLERVDEKRISFLFAKTEEIEKAISDYWADAEISLPIQRLFQNQRQLKNRLYAFK